MPTWLITGTSRGIGLELTRQLASSVANVIFATCRSPASASALNTLAETRSNVHVVQLDVEEEGSIKRAYDTITSSGVISIDYLVNNAGTAALDTAATASPDALDAHFRLHVTSPYRVFHAFLPLVQASERKVVVNVSTNLGSLDKVGNYGPHFVSYSVAKAGLNMLTRKLAAQYIDIIIFAFSPGWIKTDLGGPNATHDVERAVALHIPIYESARIETHAGKFIDLFGKEVPW